MSGKSVKTELEQDGYAVVENFLARNECEDLKKVCVQLTKSLAEDETRMVFTSEQDRSSVSEHKYFLDSNDKIRGFYEIGALDPNGKLLVEPEIAFNKVGHALHFLQPDFRRVTYSEKVKKLCKDLGFKEPAVVQSMCIFKNPGIGGKVVAHRDATFLYTAPTPPVGFWIALEDATLENGCLQMIPGSHKSALESRLVCKEGVKEMVFYNDGSLEYKEEEFIPLIVKAGTLVLIHGYVLHQSAENKSSKSRHAYTFHVIEKKNNNYSKDNWLQEGAAAPFVNLYSM